MYRQLKLRGAIVRLEDRSVVLLPREKVFVQLDGVWNLANDAGNLGAITVTSQRFLWRAQLTENYNVSLPYFVLERVGVVAMPKFGPTLVLAVAERHGGARFGFRVDPPERLATLEKEVRALREAAFFAPDFGVVHEVEEAAGGGAGGAPAAPAAGSEDVAVAAELGAEGDAYAPYFAEGGKEGERAVIFSEELGLAVETPPAGLSISTLWATL